MYRRKELTIMEGKVKVKILWADEHKDEEQIKTFDNVTQLIDWCHKNQKHITAINNCFYWGEMVPDYFIAAALKFGEVS